MKLKFQTRKLLDMSKEDVAENIKVFLKTSNYRIIRNEVSSITFNEDTRHWKLVSNSIYYRKIESGEFEFISKSDHTEVRLVYFISITFEVLQLLFFLFLAFAIDYHAFFLIFIFGLNFLFKVLNIRYNIIDWATNVK